MRSLVVIAVFALMCGFAQSQDRPDRSGATDSERVRVALALSKSKVLSASANVAPAPRPSVSDWAQARDESIKDGRPVVVYVGCAALPKIITSAHEVNVSELGEYKSGTAIVFYPQSGRMWAESAIPCSSDKFTDEVESAVKSAAKKTKLSGKTKLNWS